MRYYKNLKLLCVYVLTPSLNKSFKFQSDWPYNNSQIYLLQSIINDIENDDNKTFKNSEDNYFELDKFTFILGRIDIRLVLLTMK